MPGTPPCSRRRLVRGSVFTVIGLIQFAALTAKGAEPPPPPEQHPTRILARFHDTGHGAAQTASVTLSSEGVRVTRHVPSVPGLVVLDRMPMAQSVALGAPPSLDDRIASLRRTGLFAYVEPDYRVSIDRLATDERLADGTLWGLRNAGQDTGTPGIDIAAARAWDITTGSRDVIVAVVDTGIDYTHTELRDQMWRNPGEVPGNGIDDDGNGIVDDVFGLNAIDPSRPPLDDHDHGTHVAGTIGAAANDGHPHVGVAWDVRLMACKFLSDLGTGYTSDAVTCIDYATRHGASIINASWGGGGYSQALVDSIQAAGDAGVLFVAAAGNAALDQQSEFGERYPAYPASYDLDTIISVAAIDRSGGLAWFSNFGHLSVDLGAPGVDIFSSVASVGKTGYGTFRGTSMATPHVVGVAALAKARHPGLSARELKALLLHTATRTPSLAGKTVTGGRVNAYSAVASTADGRLEVALSFPDTHTAFSLRPLRIEAHVTDLQAVSDARVTGSANGIALPFRDDGVAPDSLASDGIHTAEAVATDDAATLSVEVRAEAAGRQPATCRAILPKINPPPNDGFAAATTIRGDIARVIGTSIGASSEPGEPLHAGQPGGSSVWWRWTASHHTRARIFVKDTMFVPFLAVYTGDGVDALTMVAYNDNPLFEFFSSVTFQAQAGTTYFIAVDGMDGNSGALVMELVNDAPPANDHFADAQVIAGPTGIVLGTTVGCTNEPDETSSWGHTGGSVWFRWTAPHTGAADVQIISRWYSYDSCEVYTGDDVAHLVAQPNFAPSFFAPSWQRHVFHATKGETYHIAVRPVAEAIEYFQLALASHPSPDNDDFADRIHLDGDNVTVEVDNRGAAPEALEPNLLDAFEGISNPIASVWYSWAAPKDGIAWVHTDYNSSFLSALGAFTGDDLASLQRIGLGNQRYIILLPTLYGNHMMFPARAGETYSILAGGVEGSSGVSTMHIAMLNPPANTEIETATPIREVPARFEGSTLGATGTVWWEWTAPSAGMVIVEARTTEFGPVVSGFRYDTDAPLQEIYNTQLGLSRFVCPVEPGVRYLFGVNGDPFGGSIPGFTGPDGIHGRFELTIELVSVPNDSYLRRAVLAGEPVDTVASNRTSQAGFDPGFGVSYLNAPLWWSWTAPITGSVTLSTAGTSLDTILGVFADDPSFPTHLLAFNDDARQDRKTSEVILDVEAGSTYIIVVDTPSSRGEVSLSIRRTSIPENDLFANRVVLDPANPSAIGSNLGANAEAGEPHHAFTPAAQSVWWTWTAPVSGQYVVSTEGSSFDTTLGVYTGDSVNTLRWIGGNDDAPGLGLQSRVTLVANAGTTHQIAVDGYQGACGTVSLRIQTAHPPSYSLLVPIRPIPAGSPMRLVVDPGQGSYTFQWFLNGLAIPGATGATYEVPLVQRFHAGTYSVVINGPGGPIRSGPIPVEVAEPPPSNAAVVNLSTRALCRGGDEVLIPGFVISGQGTRHLLLRAVGPDLMPLGVQNPLPDPMLVVVRHEADSVVELARNDDWADQPDAIAVQETADAVYAFPLSPTSSSAAVLLDLPAGMYTVIASGHAFETGIALVELYDVPEDGHGTARLVNLSTRGYIGAGDEIMIPGFVVSGDAPQTFLLRAVGPGLTSIGASGTLADPELHIYRHEGESATKVLSNDSWGEHGSEVEVEAVAAAVGAFPIARGSTDAAIVVTLPPGVYTAHAVGALGSRGILLVELYLVP